MTGKWRKMWSGLAAMAIGTTVALAQDAAPPSGKPSEPPAAKPAEPPPDLDLDSLLDVPTDKTPREGDAGGKSPDEARVDLEQRLAAGKADEALKQAVDLMSRAADRLEARRDASLDTQRLQADAITKLDQLIKQAEQQQQQRQQKSKQRQQQQQQQQGQQQQQQKQNQQRPGQSRPSDQRQGTNTEEMAPPSRQEGPLGAAAARGAAWGSLPACVREALSQGSSDKYSTVYQRLTKLYYQRLAEEKPR